MKLHELRRPKTWREVVAQPQAVKAIDRVRQSGGLTGRAYWISGPSGTGKTTLARLIAAEVSEPFYRTEMDGSKLTGAHLEEWENLLRYRPLEGKAWVFIINEAHLLTPRIIGRLLVRIDDAIKDSEVWIFTTTSEAQKQLFDARLDSSAFLSRCVRLTLTVTGKEDTLAQYVKGVAEAAGLDGSPLSVYRAAIVEAKGNLRAVINAIEAGQLSEDKQETRTNQEPPAVNATHQRRLEWAAYYRQRADSPS